MYAVDQYRVTALEEEKIKIEKLKIYFFQIVALFSARNNLIFAHLENYFSFFEALIKILYFFKKAFKKR